MAPGLPEHQLQSDCYLSQTNFLSSRQDPMCCITPNLRASFRSDQMPLHVVGSRSVRGSLGAHQHHLPSPRSAPDSYASSTLESTDR
ncbi:hypothetical protein B0T16DRAFT_399676 [Cercophora newfieldiana]|uniref:Uncharacterized protein n=1 Tax=Cercophora newfieldiana TaxID=92897 RepID=A0AA40CYS3_9PEZI|nr:hypothetical protein B0T16DRAFT_399676 [Cercophora newfieldiana]